ncbi:MAG: hypothetical protein IJZ80_01900 [Clostridia bacterium]|nr:hypothetical protein [Clostridia bacterium]
MNLPNIKKTSLITILLIGVLGILLGVLLLAIDPAFLLKILFVVMGIITVLSAVPGLLVGISSVDTAAGRVSLIVSLISIVIGFLMIFWHSSILMIVLGIYLLVFPLIEILLSKDKAVRLKSELPKMIVGLVLILVGPAKALDVMLDIAGWGVIVLSVVYVVLSLFAGVRNQNKKEATTGNRIFVDTTGDGKVDTVYVDTTGDGKPDTAKRYRDSK